MTESAWKEIKTKMWARIKEIEKFVPGYDYSEAHRMIATDDRMKVLMVDELRKSKKLLFDILDTSYQQQKEGLTKDFHRIRDDVDIFLDEVKVKHVIRWPESFPQEFLQKIVMHDSEIIREMPKLISALEEVRKQVLEMEKPGTSLFDREQLDKLNKRAMQIKKQADGLVKLFKERELLLGLHHIHREDVYEELRSRMESTY